MVSCCSEIMACDVKNVINCHSPWLLQNTILPPLGFPLVCTCHLQINAPSFRNSSAKIVAYLLMEINENSEIQQQMIRMYA